MVSENGCPMFSQSVTVNIIIRPNKPTISAIGNIAPCTNDSMLLMASSGGAVMLGQQEN